jgi:hypothetical protein
MRIVRILLAIIGLLVLAAAGLLVAAHYVDWNAYRPQLSRLVSDATGRELTIRGDLAFQLWPTPRLSADGLSLANASWAGQTPMIEAQSLALTIVPRALLARQIRLRRITLGNARLLLQTDAQGRGNWQFNQSGGTDATAGIFDHLSRLDVDSLSVTWHPHGEKARSFNIDRARLTTPMIGKGMDFDVTGSADGKPVSLTGRLESLAGFLRGEGLSGRIRRESPALKIDLDGDFGRLPALDGVDITVSASGTEWPVLAQMAGFPTGETPPWKTRLELKGAPGKLSISNMRTELADSDIAGDFRIALDRSRPNISGKFHASSLDLSHLDQWWVGETTTSSQPESADSRFFSDQPVRVQWMEQVDLDLELTADRLVTEVLELDAADVAVRLRDGRLVASAGAQAFGGQASAHLDAQPIGEALQYKHRLELRDADAARITGRWSDPPLVDARANLDYEISGTGRSAADFWSDASGSLELVIGSGTIRAAAAERAVRNLIATFFLTVLARAKEEDTAQLNCLASKVTITGGLANFDVLVLDTGKSTLVGTGTADLRTETWDVKIKPRPKRTTLTTATSITVTGPFTDPKVTLDKVGALKKLAGAASLFVFPPAAIAGLGELGSGDNVCLQLIAGGGAE